jgi:uncharacterized protein
METAVRKSRLSRFLTGVICVLGLAATTAFAASPSEADLISAGTRWVDLLAAGDFSNAVARFDATMRVALPEPKLQEVWLTLQTQAGAYQKRLRARVMKQGPYDMVLVSCQFERATLDAKVVLSGTGQVAGLYFAPSQELPIVSEPPPYARTNAFLEEDFTVGSGEWRLPGTLTRPTVGSNPAPALVLVHGSGPNDRDETVGANKPFRDLAWGLGSSGIAVLRYEKRTKVYAVKFSGTNLANLTAREEAIDDALAAAAQLRATRGVDPKRVFVLGHSLGGTLAPRIGQADPKLAGLVLLAGASRPLEDLVVEQTRYLLSLSGGVSAADQQKLDTLQADADKVKRLSATDANPPALILGAPPKYWLDLRQNDPLAAARALQQPLLILQGGRDYQATKADFDGWRAALRSRPNVTFKLYPQLNHLFSPGEGKSTPAEYERPAHVAEIVITDIAAWIQAH